MRYVMKQKLFCWGDDFVIQDAAGTARFLVDGKAFSFGEKLSFQDMAGREVAFIQQKILSWGPTYEVYRGGILSAMGFKLRADHAETARIIPSRQLRRLRKTDIPTRIVSSFL